MPEAEGLVLGTYRPEESDEALALERRCTQGTSYRLSFWRPTFHRRAEAYPEWRIVTARLEGSLVGLVAGAIKPVELRGEPMPAAFFFDLRVHPAFRGRGVARRLTAEIRAWASARADLAYTYAMADNGPAAGLVRLFGGVDVGGYAYLVYPTYRRWPASPGLAAASFEEVHRAMKRACGPFDLYARPEWRPGESGYAGSWMVRRGDDLAGCSAWSHQEVLAEVVESVPWGVQVADRVTRSWPFRLAPWPHLPRPGERLRSWYLFDCFATDAALARTLMRQVTRQAREQGLDYCYVIHGPRNHWIRALRADVPRLFAPMLPYRLWADLPLHLSGPLDRLYVDVRDL